MSRYDITDAQRKDLPHIAAIERQIFDNPWSVDALHGELERSIASLRVARAEATIIGYMLSWQTGDTAEIIVTAVRTDHRRQGVGRALLRDLCDQVRINDGRYIFLEVRRSNGAAIALYDEMGFHQSGCRPGYYGDGEDAMTMTLDLQCDMETYDLPAVTVKESSHTEAA